MEKVPPPLVLLLCRLYQLCRLCQKCPWCPWCPCGPGRRAFAGSFQQVSTATGAMRSRSLWDADLARPVDVPSHDWTLRHANGPFGEQVTLVDNSGNRVNVVSTDVDASNGVIHVLDAVLLPTL